MTIGGAFIFPDEALLHLLCPIVFFVDNLLEYETFSSFPEYKEESHHLNLMRKQVSLAEKLFSSL
jgi:hypothetical protein